MLSGQAKAELNYQTRRSIVPAVLEPTAIPPTPPAPPLITSEPSGGFGQTTLFILLGLLAVFVAFIWGRFLFLGNRNQRVAAEIARLSQRAEQEGLPPAAAPGPRAETGLSVSVKGPGVSERYSISNVPVTVGSASINLIRLEAGGDEIAAEHARVWVRDGRLVYHQIATDYKSTWRGEPITWVSLGNGDEIQVGPYRLRVEVE